MRTFLLQIHLYAALLCPSYFVIFGLSSLNFNHHFGQPVEVDHAKLLRPQIVEAPLSGHGFLPCAQTAK
jgi:hypothetical protein